MADALDRNAAASGSATSSMLHFNRKSLAYPVDDSVALAVCTDEAYALYAAMALRSATLSISSERKIEGYFVDCGVEPDTRKRVERALDITNLNLHWEHVDTRNFDHLPHSKWTSEAAFARLCVPYLLPDEISHFIYLDSDIFVLRDIYDLWSERSKNSIISACEDWKYPKVKYAKASSTLVELGKSPNDTYFNSGLLIVNREEWINNKISATVCYLSKKYGERFTHKDQDPLNLAVGNEWSELDKRWNVVTYKYRQEENISINPYTIHFTEEKPDKQTCTHPERKKYIIFVFRSRYFKNRYNWIKKW